MNEQKKDPNCGFLKLSQFVRYFLSGPEPFQQYDRRIISKTDAEIIEILAKDTFICYIQWESHDGIKLQYPILWNYKSWREDCDSWLMAKRKAETEKLADDILKKNIKILALELQYETALTYAQCLIKAEQHLRKGSSIEDRFDVKLITTKEEL